MPTSDRPAGQSEGEKREAMERAVQSGPPLPNDWTLVTAEVQALLRAAVEHGFRCGVAASPSSPTGPTDDEIERAMAKLDEVGLIGQVMGIIRALDAKTAEPYLASIRKGVAAVLTAARGSEDHDAV